MLKRFTETGFVPIVSLKKWTGTEWKPCQFLKRWTGTEWQTIWVGVTVEASLSPNYSDYNGYIDYPSDGYTIDLNVGYRKTSSNRYYQTGYIRITGLTVGQQVEFEMKMNYSSYTRRYVVSGLDGGSGEYKNTVFWKISGITTSNTVTISCYTDLYDTLHTFKNLTIDGTLIPLK